jgi:hypothetical protein
MPTSGHEYLFCKRGVQKAIERDHPISIAGFAGHFHWHSHSFLVSIFCDGIATVAEYDILSLPDNQVHPCMRLNPQRKFKH